MNIVTNRWTAKVLYRSDSGIVDVVHHIEELEDLQEIIEKGPNFYTIDRIEIKPQRLMGNNFTLEKAETE